MGYLRRGQPAWCQGPAEGTVCEGRALTESSTSIYLAEFPVRDWQPFTSELWGPLVHLMSLCVLPFRFIHCTGVVEAAGGCEIWRHGFLPATSSPGRQPQSSTGSGRSDEEQSCKWRSARCQLGHGGWVGLGAALGGRGPREVRVSSRQPEQRWMGRRGSTCDVPPPQTGMGSTGRSAPLPPSLMRVIRKLSHKAPPPWLLEPQEPLVRGTTKEDGAWRKWHPGIHSSSNWVYGLPCGCQTLFHGPGLQPETKQTGCPCGSSFWKETHTRVPDP